MGPLFSPASANAIQSSGRTGWPAVIVAPVTSPALVPSLGVGRKVPQDNAGNSTSPQLLQRSRQQRKTLLAKMENASIPHTRYIH
jgi:hypothetical protein